jgi:hypothetical protein
LQLTTDCTNYAYQLPIIIVTPKTLSKTTVFMSQSEIVSALYGHYGKIISKLSNLPVVSTVIADIQNPLIHDPLSYSILYQ